MASAAPCFARRAQPGDEVNRSAIDSMAEKGIDIAQEYPKPWTDEIVQAADVVVTIGCEDACHLLPRQAVRGLGLDDPAGRDVADIRPIRDDIERRMLSLLKRAEGSRQYTPDSAHEHLDRTDASRQIDVNVTTSLLITVLLVVLSARRCARRTRGSIALLPAGNQEPRTTTIDERRNREACPRRFTRDCRALGAEC
jgi:hypothetical protein